MNEQIFNRLVDIYSHKQHFEQAIASHLQDVFTSAKVVCSFDSEAFSLAEFQIGVMFQEGASLGVETPKTELTGWNEEAGFSATLDILTGSFRQKVKVADYEKRIVQLRASMARGLVYNSPAMRELFKTYSLVGHYTFGGRNDSADVSTNSIQTILSYNFKYTTNNINIWTKA